VGPAKGQEQKPGDPPPGEDVRKKNEELEAEVKKLREELAEHRARAERR
jgi:ribosomal protein L29